MKTDIIKYILWANSSFETVGYHLPFQHNELFHMPYMAIAETSPIVSVQISLRLRVWRAFPIIEVYPYSITNPMFLLLTVSLL